MKPLGDRVALLPPADEDSVIAGGIIIPKEVKEKKAMRIAEVVALGPDVTLVKIGDKVLFNEYGFELVEQDKQEYFIGAEENLLAIIQDENS